MFHGTLGESDTDVESDNPHNFEYATRFSIRNSQNMPSVSKAAQVKRKSTLASENVRGAARRKITARQKKFKQFKEIMKLQNSTHLLIPKLPFARLVREISLEINPNIVRYTYTAIEGLQEATEAFLTQMFQDAYLLTMHRKCVTLSKADIILLRGLKMDF